MLLKPFIVLHLRTRLIHDLHFSWQSCCHELFLFKAIIIGSYFCFILFYTFKSNDEMWKVLCLILRNKLNYISRLQNRVCWWENQYIKPVKIYYRFGTGTITYLQKRACSGENQLIYSNQLNFIIILTHEPFVKQTHVMCERFHSSFLDCHSKRKPLTWCNLYPKFFLPYWTLN